MEQPSFPKKQLVKQVTWRHNDTALHVAVRAGNLEEVKQILSGVSVPVSDSRGSGVASDRVVIDVGNTKFQSDLIAAHNDLGETALYVAADSGQTEIVKELLQYADLEAAGLKTQSGYDALHTAAKHGYLGNP